MTQLRQLTNRLIAISRDWNQYDLVPEKQKAEVRAIGSALNSSGGIGAMQAAYYEGSGSVSGKRIDHRKLVSIPSVRESV